MNGRKSAILYLLTLVFLFLFLRNVDFSSAKRYLFHIPPLFPLLFGVGIPIGFLVRAWRWRILLCREKSNLSLSSLFHFIAIGYLVSYALPGRLGEVARPVLLAEKEGIRKSVTVATIVFERLIDTLLVLLLFLFSMVLLPSGKGDALQRIKGASLLFSGILAALTALIFLLPALRRHQGIERAIERVALLAPVRFRSRLGDALRHFLDALHPRLNASQTLRYAAGTILLFAQLIFFYWLLSLGMPAMRLGLSQWLVFFTFIYVSSAVPLPGMAGSLDLASRFALVTLLGVSEPQAVAYTVLFHFLLLAVSGLVGIVSFWREGLKLGRLWSLRRENEMS